MATSVTKLLFGGGIGTGVKLMSRVKAARVAAGSIATAVDHGTQIQKKTTKMPVIVTKLHFGGGIGTGVKLTSPNILPALGVKAARIAAGSIATVDHGTQIQKKTTKMPVIVTKLLTGVVIGTGVKLTSPNILPALGVKAARIAAGSIATVDHGTQIQKKTTKMPVIVTKLLTGVVIGTGVKLMSPIILPALGVKAAGVAAGSIAAADVGIQLPCLEETLSKMPISGTSLLIGLGVGTGVTLISPIILPALGFKVAGVAAGSIAAGIQTPTTAAGSWFAVCQSAGVLGISTSNTAAISAALGTTATAVAELRNYM